VGANLSHQIFALEMTRPFVAPSMYTNDAGSDNQHQ